MPELVAIELKAHIPALDFEVSKQFYQDIGFTLCWSNGGLALLHYGPHGEHGLPAFLLQDHYVKELSSQTAGRPSPKQSRKIRSFAHQLYLITSELTTRIPGPPEEMRKCPSRAANALPSKKRASAPRRDGMRCIALCRETGGIRRKYIVSRAMLTLPVPPGSRGPIEERRKGVALTPASARSSTRIPPHPYRTVLPSAHCLPSSVGFLFLVSRRFTAFLIDSEKPERRSPPWGPHDGLFSLPTVLRELVLAYILAQNASWGLSMKRFIEGEDPGQARRRPCSIQSRSESDNDPEV